MSAASIRDTFFEECEELLEALVEGLAQLEEAPGNAEVINAVFRAVHSIKGGAGAFGLDRLVAFAHALETVMDRLRDGALAVDGRLMALFHRAGDQLSDLVAAARDDADLPATVEQALLAELEGYFGAPPEEEAFAFEPLALDLAPPAEEAAPRQYTIRFTPHRALYDNGHEPLLLFDALAELGDLSVQADLSSLPEFDSFDPGQAHLGWTLRLTSGESETVLQEVFEFVEGLCRLEITTAAPARPVPEEESAAFAPPAAPAPAREARGPKPTLRVDLDRVDRLINTVGELIINQAMISQRLEELDLPTMGHLSNELEAYKLLARDIQEGVMAIRAQPVKPLFQRMARIVREASDATGKQVRLTSAGDSTEVDKTVIERLADPLTHMIRNAVDHGVELPQARIAAGKAPEGTIRLSAAHRSGSVFIEVSDDGAGLDRPRILAKAMEKGLVPPEAELQDQEIDNLLFLPGFSTAGQVSSLSGRGVGMDVVKNAVQALGGRISILSTPGEGTCFSIILPLTLAVLDGFVISVGRETMVIPIASILETIRPNAPEIHRVGPEAEVVRVRGAYVPIVDVARSLGLPGGAPPGAGILLLVNTESQGLTALRVGAIHDQRQVVIKSLESNYAAIPGVSAATILGDGKIALILDPEAVIRLAPDAPPPPARQELRHA